MDGKLHSLTDVLKRTLFFFENLSVAELTPYVHQKMLQDYSPAQVEEKINLCLRQHSCFYLDKNNTWHLNLEGNRENDPFYAFLLKRKQPMSLKEMLRSSNFKNKDKKVRWLVGEEASLISDGRFIQLENGHWGLTEWEVETGHYLLKHLLIKALKLHPAGLTTQQLFELVQRWHNTTRPAVDGVLRKFPYFENAGEDLWVYNPAVRVAYENLRSRFLEIVNKQKRCWQHKKEDFKNKIAMLEKRLQEVSAAHEEIAAALAQKVEEIGKQEQLLTQMAEKDLLLSLRKKEIFRYREHINKLEAKANSILHQCRLWVKRARDKEAESLALRETLDKTQASLEALFSKLQQYKERDRENKAKLTELKEHHATRVAELQTEIIELRQRMERIQERAAEEEERLKEEITLLSNNLRDALKREEEQQFSIKFAQQELVNCQEDFRRLQSRLKHPLVRFTIKVLSILDWRRRR